MKRVLLLSIFIFCACDNPSDVVNNNNTNDAGQPDADTVDSALDSDITDADTIEYTEEVWPVERVYFRTARRSFNRRYYVALEEGKIWVKPNEEMTGETGEWEILGSTGKPEGSASSFPNFGIPDEITSISADGVHLMAISSDGNFYRGSDLTTDISSSFTWTDSWGGVMADGTGMVTEFPISNGWSVSDSHPFGVEYYTDIDGTDHSVGLGVAHVYRLGEDGHSIYWNDWWLPNDWSRQICGPMRSTAAMANISVSASTMFVILENGQMYTRLYDFDTGGENSLLEYSYIIQGPSGTTRKLPSEDWRSQPEITDGVITKRITIFQNGTGNAARVLRVEGRKNGTNGFFQKEIFADNWTFVPTDLPMSGPFLDTTASLQTIPPSDYSLSGTITKNGKTVQIELENFNMVCSPARAKLWVDGELVTENGGSTFYLEFHHVHTMVDNIRPKDYWLSGMTGKIQAALVINNRVDNVDDSAIRNYLDDFFTNQKVINFVGYAGLYSLSADEIPWDMPFRVPGNEKSFLTGFTITLN